MEQYPFFDSGYETLRDQISLTYYVNFSKWTILIHVEEGCSYVEVRVTSIL